MNDLQNCLKDICGRLRGGEYQSEAEVEQGIVLRILEVLGWQPYDNKIVWPEYEVEGRRVDFALCHPARKPVIFIEVQKIGLRSGADRQLFEYVFMAGVPMAVFTNGHEWSFYLPPEQGSFDERCVYKLDLLEREISESVTRLDRYLRYSCVCSGGAVDGALSDYKNVA